MLLGAVIPMGLQENCVFLGENVFFKHEHACFLKTKFLCFFGLFSFFGRLTCVFAPILTHFSNQKCLF